MIATEAEIPSVKMQEGKDNVIVKLAGWPKSSDAVDYYHERVMR